MGRKGTPRDDVKVLNERRENNKYSLLSHQTPECHCCLFFFCPLSLSISLCPYIHHQYTYTYHINRCILIHTTSIPLCPHVRSKHHCAPTYMMNMFVPKHTPSTSLSCMRLINIFVPIYMFIYMCLQNHIQISCRSSN